jgi:hypothetical protein
MGFGKTILATFIGGFIATVAGGIVLLNLDSIKEWVVNSIGLILFYFCCLLIGALIGGTYSLVFRFFKWLFYGIFKWLKIVFTLNKLNSKINTLFRELANGYFNLAQENLFIFLSDKKSVEYVKGTYSDMDSHFSNLALYYKILRESEVELNSDDFGNFKRIKNNISEYHPEYVDTASEFLSSFNNFLQYCEKKPNYLEQANEVWTELQELFGSKRIKEVIEEWESKIKKKEAKQ